jgi:hypothetical protein
MIFVAQDVPVRKSDSSSQKDSPGAKKPDPAKPAIQGPTPPVQIKPGIKNPNIPDPMKPGINKPMPGKNDGARLAWKWKEGDVFWQELVVSTRTKVGVAGLDNTMQIQYGVMSKFTLEKRNEDGSLTVKQQIEVAKLEKADDITQTLLGDPVAKLQGQTFTLTLDPQMAVTKFEGGGEKINIQPANLLGGQGFAMGSVLDQDGWKELAQATFFQPEKPLQANDKWTRPMTHNWGPLGQWTGETAFAYLGKQANLHRVSYTHRLNHQPPKAGGNGIAVQFNNASFKSQNASGIIYFDAERGKVAGVEERFHVKGSLSVSLLGQQTAVEVEEDQTFRIRIWDKNPLKK